MTILASNLDIERQTIIEIDINFINSFTYFNLVHTFFVTTSTFMYFINNNNVYLISKLLLSGDIETNPGPTFPTLLEHLPFFNNRVENTLEESFEISSVIQADENNTDSFSPLKV